MTDVGTTIQVQLNGKPREIDRGLTVRSLLESLDLHPGMVVVELNRILRANPSDVRAHLSVANVHSKMGQVEKAREHFQKVIQIQPNHPQARSIKGWLGGQRGVVSGENNHVGLPQNIGNRHEFRNLLH